MGNSFGKVSICFTGAKGIHRRSHDVPVLLSDPYDEGLGHSFCYVRPDPTWLALSKVHSEEATTFKTISGASVSANMSTPLSTALVDLYSYNNIDRAASFESSTSFASIPLQPIPRNLINNSGPISSGSNYFGGSGVPGSGSSSMLVESSELLKQLETDQKASPEEKVALREMCGDSGAILAVEMEGMVGNGRGSGGLN